MDDEDLLFDEDEIDRPEPTDYFTEEELAAERQRQYDRDVEMAGRVQERVDNEAAWYGTPGTDRGFSGNPTPPGPGESWTGNPSTVGAYPDVTPGAPPGSTVLPSTAYVPPGTPAQPTPAYQFGYSGAFQPQTNNLFGNAYDWSAAGAQTGERLTQAGAAGLQQGYSTPQAAAPERLNAPAPTDVVTTSTARSAQEQATELALARARGDEPGIGEALMGEAAARAASAQQQAGVEANAAYGQQAIDANRAYAEALAAQEEMARANNEDAIRRGAGLVAAQRGGNVALAAMQAGNTAATQSAELNRDLLQQTAAGRRQAADMQARQATDIQRAHEQAGIRAAEALAVGDYQAAQLAQQEQQQYAQLLAQNAAQTRQMDLGEIDALLRQSGMNAEQAYQYDVLNANDAFRYAQMNGDWQQAANVLSADINSTLLAQGISLQQSEVDRITELAMADIEAGIAYEVAVLNSIERQRDRELGVAQQVYGEQQTNYRADEQFDRTLLTGGLGAAGTVLGKVAPVLSDERRKEDKVLAATPNFRDAKPYTYTYDEEASRRYGYDDEEEFCGPMAQDLPEETVRETRYGDLEVDIGRLALSLASAVGELQERVDAQEEFGFDMLMELAEQDTYGPEQEESDEGDGEHGMMHDDLGALVQIMIGMETT